MVKMKTLTVSGQTYTVCDPEAVRSVDGRKPDAEGNVRMTDDSCAGELPWSGRHIADVLCPPFTETAAAVTCTPVAGYPLLVTAQDGATVTRCGKNLLDVQSADAYHTNAVQKSVTMTRTATGMRLECVAAKTDGWLRFGFCLGKRKDWAGKTITVTAKYSSGMTHSGTSLGGSLFGTNVKPTPAGKDPIYNNGGYIGTAGDCKNLSAVTSKPITYTVTGEEEWEYIGLAYYFVLGGAMEAGDVVHISDIQVEIGTTATAYEPFRCADTFAAGEQIPALPGVNTLYADGGEITVAGRADPVRVMEKLTNAVQALGGSI